MNNLHTFNDYLKCVINDATTSLNRPFGTTKYQMIEINNTIIVWIKTEYMKILCKTKYRLMNNYKKHTKPGTEIVIYFGRYARLFDESENNKLEVYPNCIPPHHTIARCDFWGTPTTIANIVDGAYLGFDHGEHAKEHLSKMKEEGFDYLCNGLSCSYDDWTRYVSAMRAIYNIDIPNITDQIIGGAV